VNEPLLRVALTALQAASAISQNQGTEKGEAPLVPEFRALSQAPKAMRKELAGHDVNIHSLSQTYVCH